MFSWRTQANQAAGPSSGSPSRGRGRAKKALPKGELIHEINADKIEYSNQENQDPRITDCVDVASYTWMKNGTPSIIIPGEPPLWSPLPENHKRQLKQDRGNYFKDPNAARYPRYPMAAAVHAILGQNPDFNRTEINVVACSSTLASLSRFVRGVNRDFRMVVENVDGTIFLLRRENSPMEFISDIRGYGHRFLEKYTAWDMEVEGSESHYRVIRYNFGGLVMLVRFEADGYIPNYQNTEETEEENIRIGQVKRDTHADDLVVRVHEDATDQKTSAIQVQNRGRAISQEDIVEIAARSRFSYTDPTSPQEIDLTPVTPRLWISQIPTIVVGYHTGGRFRDIELLPMRAKVLQWERENEADLRKLASLLINLREFTSKSRTKKVEVCRVGLGNLEVRELVDCEMEALSPDLKKRWMKTKYAHEKGAARLILMMLDLIRLTFNSMFGC